MEFSPMQLPPVPNVSTPPAALIGTYWPQLVVFCLANWLVTGVIVRAVADSQFMAAFDRCKDRITNRIDEWYKERHDKTDAGLATLSAHEDRLGAFEASLIEQGKAIKAELAGHFTSNTRAMEDVTDTLKAIQREAAETAKAVSRIEGFIEADAKWDGVTNRRRRVRRKPLSGDT